MAMFNSYVKLPEGIHLIYSINWWFCRCSWCSWCCCPWSSWWSSSSSSSPSSLWSFMKLFQPWSIFGSPPKNNPLLCLFSMYSQKLKDIQGTKLPITTYPVGDATNNFRSPDLEVEFQRCQGITPRGVRSAVPLYTSVGVASVASVARSGTARDGFNHQTWASNQPKWGSNRQNRA